MSICHSGLNKKVVGQLICIDVGLRHPIIKLANALSWETIADIVLPDLKSTTSKKVVGRTTTAIENPSWYLYFAAVV